VVVVVIAMVLLISSCQASANKNSLKNYAANVSTLISSSDSNGKTMFDDLKSGEGKTSPQSLQQQVIQALKTAKANLSTAEGLSVPGAMSQAQQNLLLVMKMRRDGIAQIASNIQGALNSATSSDGVYAITQGTSLLYSSDVVYKDYVGPEMAGALHGAGLAVGGTDGMTINAGQIVTDLGWLQKTDVANWIGATLPTSEVNQDQPGVHGHILNGVSVGTNTMTTLATNTVKASPAPTFTLNITNGGQWSEYDVVCQVKIKGLHDTGTYTIPETTSGETTNCDVTLPHPPTPGTYSVTAGVLPVPGEKNTADNYMTFSVDFTS